MGKTMGKKIAVFMIIFAILLSWDGVAYAAKVNFYNSSVAELDKINFNNLSTKDGLTSDLITYIYQDSIGYMWIGTKDGLNQYNGNMVVQYTYQYGNEKSLTSPCITSINEDDSGNIWVGTDSGLNIINRNEDKVIRIESGEQNEDMLSNYVITSIYKDSYGVMWVGTTNGLNRYDEKNNKFIKYYSDGTNTNITNNYITDIDENELGELWVSTMNGISIIDLKTYSIRNGRDKYNNIEYIYSVDKDNYGDMWVLGKESVFKIINKDYEVGIYNIYDCENLSGTMTKVLCHSNGDVWLSRGTGLIRYTLSSNETKIYTETSNYLISNSISCLYEDKSGVLWVGTNKGLSKFIINENRFINFTERDGVSGNQFNKRAAYKTKEGHLLFGTTEGVVSFDPNNIEEITPKVDKVVLDTLLINGELFISDGDNIELNHDENNITIQYFLPNYTRIGSITYLYKMDGVNKEWISDSRGGYATYTMLKPGKYTFRVKAVKSDGSFTEESTVSFVIKKPFWKSNIVYCIFIIVALLIILNIVYRVKFLKKLVDNQTKEINRQLEENKKLYERNIRNEKFKNDYFVNLSHELRTPISIILSVLQLLDSLKENGNVTKERQLHYMDVIRKSSKSLLDIINDIIDSSKIESGTYKINKEKNIDIIYLVEETALNMSDYINSKGIELIIDPEVEELPICCDPNEIQRCIINLIGNAVKFTEENGQIKVLIKADDSNVSISIEDNGLGISKDDQEFIFKRFEQGKNINSTKVSSSGIGLTLVKYIVELHDGHVKLESELNKGSKFTIVLPIN